MTGEQKLLVAVLAQAVEDLDEVAPDASLQIRAAVWFADPRVDSTEGYTFLRCCFELGLTPSNVRRLLATPADRAALREMLRAWRNSQGQYAGGRNIGQRLKRRGRAEGRIGQCPDMGSVDFPC